VAAGDHLEVTTAAARLPIWIEDLLDELARRQIPIAEISRRIGREAERHGTTRPSYERVRQLVHEARAGAGASRALRRCCWTSRSGAGPSTRSSTTSPESASRGAFGKARSLVTSCYKAAWAVARGRCYADAVLRAYRRWRARRKERKLLEYAAEYGHMDPAELRYLRDQQSPLRAKYGFLPK
jgi:hypothetical protein